MTTAAINNRGAYADNPRGNLWLKDESTFGHKLLMKMGWKHGKGLGRNEDGIKENLKVKFRNTNSGLGYIDDPCANIMKTEYETILKNLNEKYSQKKPQIDDNERKEQDKSFSKKSKVVKSKVRYPKLFVGKDVNKYSEKDMKSIFICSLQSKNEEKSVQDSAVFPNKRIESEMPEATEVCSSYSIAEYFAKKMEEKKNNIAKEKSSGDLDNQEPSLSLEDSKDHLSSNKLSRKRKRKSDINFIPESKDDSSLEQSELEPIMLETTDSSSLSDKKSSKKKLKYSLKNISIIQTKSQSDDENKLAFKKPKKKKRKLSHVDSECNGFEIDTNLGPSLFKQEKACENGLSSNDSIMHNTHESKISCQVELSSIAASKLNYLCKKNSKSKMSTDVTKFNTDDGIEENDKSIENSSVLSVQPPLEILGSELSNVNTTCEKRKKGKKLKLKKLKSCLKSKSGSYSLKNVSFNNSVSFKIIDTDYEAFDCLVDESSIDRRDSDCETVVDDVPEVVPETSTEELHSDTDLAETIGKDEVSEGEPNKQVGNDTSIEGEEIPSRSEDECPVLDLPSSKSPHYNCWVGDQKQALKMKMYKKMLKSLKKHAVLGTSNLVSINGYGNWGFK